MIGALAIRSKNRRSNTKGNNNANKTTANKLRPQISIVSTTDEARIVRINSPAATKAKSTQLSFLCILACVSFVSGIVILVPAAVSGKITYYIAAFCSVTIGLVCLVYHCYYIDRKKQSDDKSEIIMSASSDRTPKQLAQTSNGAANGKSLKSQGSTQSRLIPVNDMKRESNAHLSQTNLSCDVAISMESTPYASRAPTPEMRVKTPFVHESASSKGPNHQSLTLPPNALIESLQSLTEETEVGSSKPEPAKENGLTRQNILSTSKDSAIHVSTESSDSVRINMESLKLPTVST